MSKAIHALTTSNVPPVASLPSILELGRQVAAIGREHARQDNLAIAAKDDKDAYSRAEVARVLLSEQESALRNLICTMPTMTLADAVVQISWAAQIAEGLDDDDRKAAEKDATTLQRVLAGVMPVLAAAAGVDLTEMDWQQFAGLRSPVRQPGARVVSRRTLARVPDPHAAPPVSIATRRDLFGTMGALLLLSAAEAGPAKAAELDGDLLACCAEALAIDAESNRLFRVAAAAGDNALPDHPAWLAHDAYDDATNPRWHELVEHIATTSARTPEGLRIKAAVARSAVPEERRDLPDPADTLAWSVLTDVLGRAGA